MGLFSSSLTLDTMDDLLYEELRDLYDAEHQILEALPKLEQASHSTTLQRAFALHRQQTQQQIDRLERIFRLIGKDPDRGDCQGAEGLIEEGDVVIDAQGNPDVKDAAIIAAAQRVEHYEIAGYGAARTFAQRLGYNDAASLLQETLDEEKSTDKELTQLAESSVNPRASTEAGF